MDPASIIGLTASIGSLLSKAVTITKALNTIHTSWVHAPLYFRLFQAELRAVRTALSNIDDVLQTRIGCLEGSIIPPKYVFQEIMAVGDTMSDLEVQIGRLLEEVGDLSDPGVSQRIGFIWREGEIKEFLEHFRAHKNTLTLHIATLMSDDTTTLRMDMQDLKAMVQALVQNQKRHEEICTRRAKSILNSDAENMSMASARTDYTSFGFDEEVFASEVYSRYSEKQRLSRVSLISISRDEQGGSDNSCELGSDVFVGEEVEWKVGDERNFTHTPLTIITGFEDTVEETTDYLQDDSRSPTGKVVPGEFLERSASWSSTTRTMVPQSPLQGSDIGVTRNESQRSRFKRSMSSKRYTGGTGGFHVVPVPNDPADVSISVEAPATAGLEVLV